MGSKVWRYTQSSRYTVNPYTVFDGTCGFDPDPVPDYFAIEYQREEQHAGSKPEGNFDSTDDMLVGGDAENTADGDMDLENANPEEIRAKMRELLKEKKENEETAAKQNYFRGRKNRKAPPSKLLKTAVKLRYFASSPEPSTKNSQNNSTTNPF